MLYIVRFKATFNIYPQDLNMKKIFTTITLLLSLSTAFTQAGGYNRYDLSKKGSVLKDKITAVIHPTLSDVYISTSRNYVNRELDSLTSLLMKQGHLCLWEFVHSSERTEVNPGERTEIMRVFYTVGSKGHFDEINKRLDYLLWDHRARTIEE